MKVNHHRQELLERLPFYSLVDDCIAGEHAIKKAGPAYLIKAYGIKDDVYEEYKKRAQFLPASEKTLNSFVALLTRKTGKLDCEQYMKEFLKENGMNSSCESVSSYAKKSLFNILKDGRIGFMCDYLVVDNEIKSLADFENSANRPVALIYPSNSIINWKYRNGKLVLVVLKEYVREDNPSDIFIEDVVEQNRVLRIDEYGRCIQEIYRKNGKKDWYLFDVKDMIVNNEYLTSIPFIIQNYDGSNPDSVPIPPLYDLCSINIQHYGISADYKTSLHVVGSPTPVLKLLDRNGVEYDDGDDDEEPFVIGHSYVNNLKAGESFEIVEMTGSGLQRLEYAMSECVENMAKAGARFLQSEKNVGESFETQYLRRSGEYSMLSSVAQSVSECITDILKMIEFWKFGKTDDIEFEIHSNFNSQPDTAEMINILVNLYLNDALPYSDLYDRLQANSLVDKTNTAEDAIEKIKIENAM